MAKEKEIDKGALTDFAVSESKKYQVGNLNSGLVDFQTKDDDCGFLTDEQFDKFTTLLITDINKAFGTEVDKQNIKDFVTHFNESVDAKANTRLRQQKNKLSNELQRRMDTVAQQLGLDKKEVTQPSETTSQSKDL